MVMITNRNYIIKSTWFNPNAKIDWEISFFHGVVSDVTVILYPHHEKSLFLNHTIIDDDDDDDDSDFEDSCVYYASNIYHYCMCSSTWSCLPIGEYRAVVT